MDQEMTTALARGDCEVIPQDRSEKDLVAEMNHRSWKRGLTNQQGECSRSVKDVFGGFGESKLNVWPRDEYGNLI